MKNQKKIIELKNGIDSKIENFLQNSEELKRFIEFRKKNFYDYSIRNTLLIYKQNPTASLVAGFKKWKSLGYNIKKGSKAISIFVPLMKKVILNGKEENKIFSYKSANVFDKSQVEPTENAVEFPTIDIKMKSTEAFQYTPMKLYRAVKKCIEQYTPVELMKDELLGKTSGKKIFISKSKNRIDMAGVMIHEFIHYNCHFNIGEKFSKSIAEVEAELGTLIFGTHFNLDISGSYKYISSYRRGVDIEKSFEKVLKIIENLIYGSEEKEGIEEILARL